MLGALTFGLRENINRVIGFFRAVKRHRIGVGPGGGRKALFVSGLKKRKGAGFVAFGEIGLRKAPHQNGRFAHQIDLLTQNVNQKRAVAVFFVDVRK